MSSATGRTVIRRRTTRAFYGGEQLEVQLPSGLEPPFEVFVNGVRQEQGKDFVRGDGGSSSIGS